VWASLTADKDTFINDVKTEMQRRDPRRRRTWVIVTDDERALQRRVVETFKDLTLVLDFLHALEKLWKSAHALYREGSPRRRRSSTSAAKRLLEGQIDQVVKGLKLIVTKRSLTGNKANRCSMSPPTSNATASECATTATCPTDGRSRPALSKAPART
jgi:hypothetical protein